MWSSRCYKDYEVLHTKEFIKTTRFHHTPDRMANIKKVKRVKQREGTKVQTPSCKINKSEISCTAWQLQFIILCCVTESHISRVALIVLTTKKKIVTVWWWVLTGFIMVVILQYIQISNHYIVLLKRISVMSIISQFKKNKKTNHTKSWWRCGGNEITIHCQEGCKMALVTLENLKS